MSALCQRHQVAHLWLAGKSEADHRSSDTIAPNSPAHLSHFFQGLSPLWIGASAGEFQGHGWFATSSVIDNVDPDGQSDDPFICSVFFLFSFWRHEAVPVPDDGVPVTTRLHQWLMCCHLDPDLNSPRAVTYLPTYDRLTSSNTFSSLPPARRRRRISTSEQQCFLRLCRRA